MGLLDPSEVPGLGKGKWDTPETTQLCGVCALFQPGAQGCALAFCAASL